MKNIEKYIFHSTVFKILKTHYLHLFFKNIEQMGDYTLECSFKIENKAVYPCRFNVWFNHDYINRLKAALTLAKQFEHVNDHIHLSFDQFKGVVDANFDFSKVRRLVLGIDFRSNLKDSRFKIWLVMDPNDSSLAKILACGGFSQSYQHFFLNQSVFLNRSLLLGFDFTFNGENQLKLYPVLFQRDLRNQVFLKELKKIFTSSVINLMLLCDRFHIGIKENLKDFIIHFHPKNPRQFIKTVNTINRNDVFNRVINQVNDADLNEIFISLSNAEILNRKIESINFYYM